VSGGMFKQRIKKYFLKKLTQLIKRGMFEIAKQAEIEKNNYNNSVAIIDPTARIESDAIIANNQNDKAQISIGKKTWLKGQLLVLAHGGKITIGDYCFIGDHSRIWSSKEIKIGNRVLISHGVNIHDNAAHSLSASYRHKEFKFIFENNTHFKDLKINEESIIIDDDVWIGFNSVILKGVRIGKGAIIGANTIVTSDIPPFAVVVGNPARIIKYATEQ
jgi:acetyltransferase-like isoleucine patch superfamily enzyme